MITALLLLVLLSGVVLGLRATIRHDGYGSRPAPHSHHDPFPTADWR